MVFTAGLDRMAYIWDRNTKECRGRLIQGYMMQKKYNWNFVLNNYESKRDERKVKVESSLLQIRQARDEDKAYKRGREDILKKYGDARSSLGFAAYEILGIPESSDAKERMQYMRGSKMNETNRTANYWLNKQENSQGLSTTIYDDTGRGLQTLKVQRLVNQARQVIARDNKKEERELRKKQGAVKGRPRFDPSMNSTFNTTAQPKNHLLGKLAGGRASPDEDENEVKKEKTPIGPFSFDIDEEIDTEVLTNE